MYLCTRMENKRLRYSTYLLIALFSCYVGCLIAFTHVHVIEGRVYVHSHFYSKKSGKPIPVEHHHCLCVLHTLQQLSSFISEESEPFVLDSVVYRLVHYVKLNPYTKIICFRPEGILSLRGPPAA